MRIATKMEFIADVSRVLEFGREKTFISSTVFLPDGEPEAVLVCWPGGSYDRRYWCFDTVPGYDFAGHATGRGLAVVAADPLGVGGSSKPSHVDGVDFVTISAAADEFVRQLRKRFPGHRLVGIGHSLGGALTVATQALHESYDRVASLGMTHGAKGFVPGEDNHQSDPRKKAVEQAQAIFQDWDAGYATGPRQPFHHLFYRPDTPADVIAADDETAAAWPRQSYVDSLVPGYSGKFAAQVKCPVLLCFGDHDVHEHPRDEVAFYASSNDIRTLVLENAAHCHNFATTRRTLWDRLCTWSTEDD
jgi:pimeloyl-ACP methyl ester carboxylesterase